MRARASLGWTGALIAATGLGTLGLMALRVPAVPAVRAPAAHATVAVHRLHVRRFNVGAAHSPQVLRQLAKGPAVRRAAISTTAYTAASPPAGVPGVDVASFQHPSGAAINWALVAGAGIKFAAIKVTEGNYYVNPWARTDLAAAQRAGLAIMAYDFAIPNLTGPDSSAAAQADFAIYHASYAYGRAPLMLDIEYDPYYSTDGTNQCYGLSPSAMVAWVQAFTAEVQSKTGQSPVIYTPKSWWDICTGGSTIFGQHMLWIPLPGSTPPGSADLPAGWSTWGIWQFTSVGSVSGISGNVDVDVLNKNLPILLADGAQQYPAGTSIQQSVQVQSSLPVTSYALTQPAGLGLTVNASGAMSGAVPATPGSYPVTVTAVTGTAGPISESTTFDVDAFGTDAVTSPGSLSTVAGYPVLRQIHVTDSVAGTTQLFSVTGLPPGLTMSSGGQITGFPVTAGTYPVTVTAIDNLGATGSTSFTWTVTAAPDTGPTGHVQLNLGGKCLTDAGNLSTDGTPAAIWTCNTSSAQQWTYAQDNTVRIHGKCLTSPAVNWVVRLYPCSAADSQHQQWELMYPRSVSPSAGARPLALVNPASGSCLSDPGSSTTNGTRVRAASCDGYQDQMWTLPAGEVVSQVPGMCVTDNWNLTANGTAIVLRVCRNSGAQQWIAGPDGTVRIHGKCLNVQGGGTSSGTPLNLWTCNGTTGQQWRLLPDSSGIDLVNPQSGLCLTDPGNSTAYGTRLRIVTCAGAPGQRWRVR
jgi:GH25 family lysozyme M1 (1,4-beta-N-acetylmuramidase)